MAWRDLGGGTLALLGVAALGVVAVEWTSAPLTVRLGMVTVPCAVLWVVLWRTVRRRTSQIDTLERSARKILDTTLPKGGHGRVGSGSAGGGGGGVALGSGEHEVPDAPEFAGLSGTLAEIAKRLNVQVKEVAKKSRNLEALIDAMDEPLFATDSAERILLCNRSAEAIFDTSGGRDGGDLEGRDGAGTLRGRSIKDLFTQIELLEMHAAARAGQTRRGRVRVTTPLGIRTFQVSALPVPAAWGEGVFGAMMVLRDVTELDQAVQVKTDFVANASHELRTPVAAIRGAAETLGEAMDDDPKMAKKLSTMIQSHAVRLEELLRDLLDLSRLESPEVPVAQDVISLDEARRVLVSMFEPICTQRDLELSFEFERELHGFKTDRRLLMLILRNLIENATKFAFEHSTVRIVGSVQELEIDPLSLRGAARVKRTGANGAASEAAGSGRRVSGVARFEVIDRGVGIPLQHQERVFERFYQVDPARTGTGGAVASTPGGSAAGGSALVRRGTGLGLAIVKHAAKRLGGRVGVSSVWGQGTTVWAEIPVAFDDASGVRAAAATGA